MNTFRFNDIKDCLIYGYQIIGDIQNIAFSNATTLDSGNADSLIWVGAGKAKDPDSIRSLTANLIIAHTTLESLLHPNSQQTVILTDAPKETFICILNKLFVRRDSGGIHPTAIIDENAKIGANVSIGAFCVVGKCEIGDETNIHSHCVIHDQCIIGKRVVIKSHTTIGSDGFGYSKALDGNYIRFPHIGGVILEDDVEVGSNTCIDRGTLGNTYIGAHSKIDNLVHVAHNVRLGKNCLVIANVLIGGSTELGDGCWIAPSATLRDGLKIVSGVTIGMGALVTKDLDVPGVYLGSPAKLKT